jgi:hypothetical protein
MPVGEPKVVPRRQIPKRHRGHQNAGSPRRLINLVTQSPALFYFTRTPLFSLPIPSTSAFQIGDDATQHYWLIGCTPCYSSLRVLRNGSMFAQIPRQRDRHASKSLRGARNQRCGRTPLTVAPEPRRSGLPGALVAGAGIEPATYGL